MNESRTNQRITAAWCVVRDARGAAGIPKWLWRQHYYCYLYLYYVTYYPKRISCALTPITRNQWQH